LDTRADTYWATTTHYRYVLAGTRPAGTRPGGEEGVEQIGWARRTTKRSGEGLRHSDDHEGGEHRSAQGLVAHGRPGASRRSGEGLECKQEEQGGAGLGRRTAGQCGASQSGRAGGARRGWSWARAAGLEQHDVRRKKLVSQGKIGILCGW
jgi:hypothetical protein